MNGKRSLIPLGANGPSLEMFCSLCLWLFVSLRRVNAHSISCTLSHSAGSTFTTTFSSQQPLFQLHKRMAHNISAWTTHSGWSLVSSTTQLYWTQYLAVFLCVCLFVYFYLFLVANLWVVFIYGLCTIDQKEFSALPVYVGPFFLNICCQQLLRG